MFSRVAKGRPTKSKGFIMNNAKMQAKSVSFEDIYNPEKIWKVTRTAQGKYSLEQYVAGQLTGKISRISKKDLLNTFNWLTEIKFDNYFKSELVFASCTSAKKENLINLIVSTLKGFTKKENIKRDSSGVCYNLSKNLCPFTFFKFCAFDFVRDYSKGWPHHSGNDDTPVPCEKYGKFNGCHPFDNTYRIDLCCYLVDKILKVGYNGKI